MNKVNKIVAIALVALLATPGWANVDDPCNTALRVTQRITRGESKPLIAIETLVASNVVANQAQADYQAGRSVTLLPGFSAEQGATFIAQVKACECDKNLFADVESEGDRLSLSAYPNPFTEKTIIRYRLNQASPVSLSVYNEKGQTVDVLVSSEMQEVGSYEYTYRNAALQTSVYLYTLRTNQGTVSKRLVKQR